MRNKQQRIAGGPLGLVVLLHHRRKRTGGHERHDSIVSRFMLAESEGLRVEGPVAEPVKSFESS